MAIRKWYGAFVAGGLVGLIAAGCSSSNESVTTDGGDGGFVKKMLDGAIAIGNGDDATNTGGFDGTTGRPCKMDADCVGPDGGAGINACSVDFGFKITGVTVALWATPVCIIPPPQSATQGNCDPVPTGVDDGLPHFCDGPDMSSSPGLCLPFDMQNPQPGQGVCYPLCTFPLDGTKPTGCIGTDECFPVSFLRDGTTGTVTGFGFCSGGCQQDSDCTGLGAGFVCQTDIGYCTMAKLKRTKAIGAACTMATVANSPDDVACDCDANPMTGVGACSTSCVVGGLPCPAGMICDAGFQNPIVFTSMTGAPINVPVTAQNVGIPGVCRSLCTPADAGVVAAAADAGIDGGTTQSPVGDGGLASCPPNTTCQNTDVVGPDCVP
jgi:hypothetical protein